MMNWFKKRGAKGLAIMLFLLILFSMFPIKVRAAKSVTLTANSTFVQVGKALEVKVEIDTGGDKVNVIGFTIDFPTETLEGLTPSQAGSVFPMCATLSATRYECGITGRDGFSGQGLITTLIFKGRKVGEANITLKNFEARFGPTGSLVSGFSSNVVMVSVTEEAQKPPPKEEPKEETPKTEEPSAPVANLPNPIKVEPPIATPPAVEQPSTAATEPPPPTESLGSESQIEGQKGAQPEEPLKVADSDGAPTSEVKGLFSAANVPYLSIFPTILMLLLVGFLGAKLVLTEKRSHMEMERMFETEIGTLAALESKLDLVDQKGDDAKEKILQEFELAKQGLSLPDEKNAPNQTNSG